MLFFLWCDHAAKLWAQTHEVHLDDTLVIYDASSNHTHILFNQICTRVCCPLFWFHCTIAPSRPMHLLTHILQGCFTDTRFIMLINDEPELMEIVCWKKCSVMAGAGRNVLDCVLFTQNKYRGSGCSLLWYNERGSQVNMNKWLEP